jgi:hypothetical protein
MFVLYRLWQIYLTCTILVDYAYFEVASPDGHTILDFVNAPLQHIQTFLKRGRRVMVSIF